MPLTELRSVCVEDFGLTVNVENHDYTDFVTHHVDGRELPEESEGFEEDFVYSMNQYLDANGRDNTDVHEYAASVGVREAAETVQNADDVEHLNIDAAMSAVYDDRGFLGTVASTFSPLGHGFQNPHRKEEDVCVGEIVGAAYEGFVAYRDKQLEKGI